MEGKFGKIIIRLPRFCITRYYLSFFIIGYKAFKTIYQKWRCKRVVRLVPTLIGLMTATGILRASGFLDVISSFIGKFTNLIGFPGELVPLSIVKMFSSSAASGLLVDLYKTYGTDSRIGLIASLSMSCTETIFYTMSVYFMTARIRHTRYTLPGAVFATFSGLAASVLLAGYCS